ncbi:MAG: ABC transporter ATP-binding protein [Oscillospiraceae bacterium]|nr:ABC transporter ATP-binding protein [Oscillospiraceae bacterium]
MLKLLRYLKRKEWLFFLLSLVFIAAQVWLDLKLPDYMSEITKLVETEGSAMNDIWTAGGMMLLCSLGSLASSVAVCFLASNIAAGFSKRLRSAMYYKVQSFSKNEIGRFSTPSLITRSTNDVMQVQMLIVMSMQVVIKAPLMAIWAITKIAGKAWQWSLATGITVAILMALMALILALTFPRFRRVQWLQDGLNRSARENLTGIRVVRAFNAEKYQHDKFQKSNTELRDNQLFANRAMTFISPIMSLSMNLLSMSIYWIGAILINSVSLNGAEALAQRVDIFADMIVFMSYAMQMIMSFLMMAAVFVIAPRAFVAAGRINEVLDTEPSVKDGYGEPEEKDWVSMCLLDPDGSENAVIDLHGSTVFFGGDAVFTIRSEAASRQMIEFEHVSYRYPGGSGDVLSDISFKIARGQTVAIVGSTGSGKTTLVNLIPRFSDPTEGRILVDGTDVKNYTLKQLSEKISYASQKPLMFTGTVASNVAMGCSAEPERLEAALRIAQADEFVDSLPDGAASPVARGGVNFSGGQKQRLSIARALCRRSDILILDDSFSALDFKTDRALRNGLKYELGDTTVIIVAQRIGTIMGADKIIVLDDGRIAGIGKHRELLSDCEVYRQIALSQLSEEELAL